MSTYPVKLTKASDNNVSHSFLLAEGRDGQPRVRLGSREKEAAKAGQRGVIVINSLHHGSGQHVARDPMMYEFADGMYADEPGEVRSRGKLQTIATLGTAEPFRAWARGAIVKVNISGQAQNADNVIAVVPSKVWMGTAVKGTPLTNSSFTGSVAVFGYSLFFGQETTDGGNRHVSTYAGRWTTGDVFYNNAGFKASFLAEQAEKLWGLETYGNVIEHKLSWTDDYANSATNSMVFASPFSLGARGFSRDIAAIGPHAVIAHYDPYDTVGRVLALDAAGQFTHLLNRQGQPLQFTPFLGGQLLWLAGSPRALWMSDVSSWRLIDLNPLTPSRGQMGLPALYGAGTAEHGKPIGMGACTLEESIYYGVYGSFTKRSGATVTGSVLAVGRLGERGLEKHIIATPETFSALENSYVIASRASWPLENTATNPTRSRVLHFLTATPEANAENSTVKLHRMDLWEGAMRPEAFDAATKFLRTSRYVGDDWVTKQGELLRGYVTELPANSSVVVRVYLDGSSNETYNFSVNTAGPFAQSLPTNVIGRNVALDMETNANGSVVIEFPWSLDYFAVPDKKDIVRLCVLAGRDQVTMGGTLTDRTRAETLQDLSDMCASPERWTLKWWDATPDWDVIPLEYETIETEPVHIEGGGAAIAWLTLQRL